MSTLKVNSAQIGQSLTATNNMTWYQPSSPDGTVRLGVGNAGATTSDVVTVSSSGLSSLALIPSGSSAPTNGMYLPTTNTLGWSTGSTERMRIDSSGNLLVGTTSFTNSNNKGLAVWFSSATNSGGEGCIEFRNTSTSTNSDNNPVLGIYKGSATTSSAQRFIQFYCSAGSQAMGGIVGNGATNVQFISLSDAREKENIATLRGSLNKINALNPVSFDWIPTGEHVEAGFVAQEVWSVFPEYVVENVANAGQEQRYGLTGGLSGGIVAHLVKAIQELSAELNELKAKVNA